MRFRGNLLDYQLVWFIAMPVLALLARRRARTSGAPLVAPPQGEAS